MEKLRALKFDTKIYLAAFIALGLLSLVFSFGKEAPAAIAKEDPAPTSVDTFIPKGYVLVPVDLANADSLSSLVGDMGGVVDLYLSGGSDHKRHNIKVASRIKLLRAPLNPQQYAVLAKENDSSKILSLPGPFIAVVQNPDSKGTEVTQSAAKSSVHIEYQN